MYVTKLFDKKKLIKYVDHSFSSNAKLSEKLTFLNVCVKGDKKYEF